ncbi:MAG: tetratricopeptide repeat protein [Candidatus Melainabacteria bacterium]|nr:tetratricopeptide repeat protein [Candidatus Melainabacteria bacterium]
MHISNPALPNPTNGAQDPLELSPVMQAQPGQPQPGLWPSALFSPPATHPLAIAHPGVNGSEVGSSAVGAEVDVGWSVCQSFTPLWLLGADGLDFLHRRSSQEVKLTALGHGGANTLLDRKARVQALFSFHRVREDALLLLTPAAQRAALVEELLRFKIMETFTVSESPPLDALTATEAAETTASGASWCLLSLVGQPVNWLLGSLSQVLWRQWPTDAMRANQVVSGLFSPAPSASEAEGAVAPFSVWWMAQPFPVFGPPETAVPGGCLLLPAERLDFFLEAFQQQLSEHALMGVALAPQAMATYRLMQGLLPVESVESVLAAAGTEIQPETAVSASALVETAADDEEAKGLLAPLLPETGLEAWTVSDTKGCYLGQETVARVKTYGALQRRLMGLRIQPLPIANDDADGPVLTSPALLNALQRLPEGSPLVNLVVNPDLLQTDSPADDPPVRQNSSKPHAHSPATHMGSLVQVVLDPEQPDCCLALAYLGKNYRTPGQAYRVAIGAVTCQVTVLSLPMRPSPVTAASTQSASAQETSHLQAKRLHDKAMQHFVAGDAEAAVAQLHQVLAQYPTETMAYESLGVILGRLNRFEEAIALMERLLVLDPDYVMAHTNLSVFYMKLGDKDRAEAEKAKATMKSFQQAMQRKHASSQAVSPPAHSASTRSTSTLLSEPTQPQAERTEPPSEAVNLDAKAPLPTPPSADEDARRHLLQERVALFEHALSFNANDPLAQYGLGTCLLELGAYARARAALEKTIALQPKHAQAYLALGQSLEALQAWPEADATYEQGLLVAAQRGDRALISQFQEGRERLQQAPGLGGV